MYGNREENVMNKKEDDRSDIRNLQGQPLDPSDQGGTIGYHSDTDGYSSKDSEESKKKLKVRLARPSSKKKSQKKLIVVRSLTSGIPPRIWLKQLSS